MLLRAHGRDEAACQIVPAEKIRFELLAQHLDRDVFNRARLPIGAIVEQGGELSIRSLEGLVGAFLD